MEIRFPVLDVVENGIHSVFPLKKVTEHGGGDAVSEKKLANGEGVWAHCKEILYWNFVGKNYTIQLPPAKCDKILHRLANIKKFKRKIPSNVLDKINGSLQHASFGIPGGSGLFSPVQMAMQGTKPWIAVSSELTQCFNDWGAIIKHMKRTPTSVLQLVKTFPHYIVYSDSCRLGTGGVVTPGLENVQPILWQLAWPTDIIELVDTDQLTINNLELAGTVLEWLVLEQTTPTL